MDVPLFIAGAAGPAVFGVAYAVHRRVRARQGSRRLAESVALGRDLPRSLHPVFDPERCIGSLSCIRACPEGEVIGFAAGRGAIVNAERCVGHGRCAAGCPTDAITLVFGTARRGVDLPELSPEFETSRPGVHVVGELGGMGLVRNAMRQGIEVVEHLVRTLPARGPATDGLADLAIVGAGPAGIATALAAKQAGLSFRLLEQEAFGGSIAHYPRRKVVLTEPVRLPLAGAIRRRRISREELLSFLRRAVEENGIRVEEGARVTAVGGADGDFTVETVAGRVRARKVVLAVGRRGTPRHLGVPGEERAKVVYRRGEPEEYRGRRVLVVGGGDSAGEAAAALAEAGGCAEVALAHRGDRLARAREAVRERVAAQATRGALRVIPGAEVEEILEDAVRLRTAAGPLVLPNDDVVVHAGGELPLDLLGKAGVSLRRYHGEIGVGPRGHPARPRGPGAAAWIAIAVASLAVIGALAALAWSGRAYYVLDPVARRASPLHATLRPAGSLGHAVGIAATAALLTNFPYAARKRVRALSGLGDIRTWLGVHVAVGFGAPLVIVVHSAFQVRNLLAAGTALALALVVLSGVVGRFIHALAASHPRLEPFLSDWRAAHAAVAVFLVLAVIVHVSVSLWLGYGGVG